ncbi:hypothetical protein A2476_04415 [candidate division CPR3 bacterium RIFOXYC2_FULL_35_7]|nr:MAG: hypothetical protein A2476_04415 [candidate division CPR3 bacterium RIFOXYC2_FULL_35_7]
MEGVTDTVLRQMICKTGKPDLFFTEFVNCDGLTSEGRDVVQRRLKFEKHEKPLILQLWGSNPDTFYEAAKLVSDFGFDGIDINMGCPQKDVMQHQAGAALIDKYDTVKEIIAAVKKGAPNLPISIKIRLGIKNNNILPWVNFLLEHQIQALTIHGRSVKEGFSGLVHWDKIGEIVKLRDSMNLNTIIIGNGSIKNLGQGFDIVKQLNLNGFMIGREILRNPWVFDDCINPNMVTLGKRLDLLQKHILLYVKTWGKTKNFANLRKFYTMYLSGFPGASNLRQQLMQQNSIEKSMQLLKNYRKENYD